MIDGEQAGQGVVGVVGGDGVGASHLGAAAEGVIGEAEMAAGVGGGGVSGEIRSVRLLMI